MNYGPMIFLAAFLALSASWFGFVLTPQAQIGGQQQATAVNTTELYPVARPGAARQGEQVYRANGCFYCHTRQVSQSATLTDVVLTDIGTNPVAVAQALFDKAPGNPKINPAALALDLPKAVLQKIDVNLANNVDKALKAAGAKSEVQIVPMGPDIERGWGRRRTVAQDFLYDSPVMLGLQRVGPDLANEGLRQPDANWHLCHLYDPRSVIKDSAMPRYAFLFEKRKIERQPSPDALRFPDGYSVPAGYEIVPKAEAIELAAYLRSLHAEAPLMEAPLSVPPPPPAATNAPVK